MAGFYLGANRGYTENVGNIAGGTVSNSTDMELFIDSGKNITKKDVQMFLEHLQLYIEGNGLADGATGTYLPPL